MSAYSRATGESANMPRPAPAFQSALQPQPPPDEITCQGSVAPAGQSTFPQLSSSTAHQSPPREVITIRPSRSGCPELPDTALELFSTYESSLFRYHQVAPGTCDFPEFSPFDALGIDPETEIPPTAPEIERTLEELYHRAMVHADPDKRSQIGVEMHRFPTAEQVKEAKDCLSRNWPGAKVEFRRAPRTFIPDVPDGQTPYKLLRLENSSAYISCGECRAVLQRESCRSGTAGMQYLKCKRCEKRVHNSDRSQHFAKHKAMGDGACLVCGDSSWASGELAKLLTSQGLAFQKKSFETGEGDEPGPNSSTPLIPASAQRGSSKDVVKAARRAREWHIIQEKMPSNLMAPCERCYAMVRIDRFSEHQSKHHGLLFYCPGCKKYLARECEEDHRISHHWCDLCDAYQFLNVSRHKKLAHHCPLCSTKDEIADMNGHLNDVHLIQRGWCCDQYFPKHLSAYHSFWQCEFCPDKRLIDKNSKEQHYHDHHGQIQPSERRWSARETTGLRPRARETRAQQEYHLCPLCSSSKSEAMMLFHLEREHEFQQCVDCAHYVLWDHSIAGTGFINHVVSAHSIKCCGQVWLKSGYDAHCDEYHPPIQCPFCERKGSQSFMRTHVGNHVVVQYDQRGNFQEVDIRRGGGNRRIASKKPRPERITLSGWERPVDEIAIFRYLVETWSYITCSTCGVAIHPNSMDGHMKTHTAAEAPESDNHGSSLGKRRVPGWEDPEHGAQQPTARRSRREEVECAWPTPFVPESPSSAYFQGDRNGPSTTDVGVNTTASAESDVRESLGARPYLTQGALQYTAHEPQSSVTQGNGENAHISRHVGGHEAAVGGSQQEHDNDGAEMEYNYSATHTERLPRTDARTTAVCPPRWPGGFSIM